MQKDDDFAKNFSDLPPFPDDVPQVPLLRLSLLKLIDGNPDEVNRLWKACTGVGFFYLDLRDPAAASANGCHADGRANGHTNGHASHTPMLDGERFIADAAQLFGVSHTVFDLPVSEKVQYDLKDQGSYFGYKGFGAGYVDAQGTKDRNEFYNISKDDVFGMSEQLPAPDALKRHYPLVSSFMSNAHSIVSLILSRLNAQLGLSDSDEPGKSLPTLHRPKAISGDQVRFVRSPPQPMDDRQVALGAHTDFGSVTLLFNRLGGLQVFPPPGLKDVAGNVENDWMHVRPLPGHCIVNLGDALVKFSAGILKSATHRVINPPGDEQGVLTRTSLVYFARPEDDVMLHALKGYGSSAIDQAVAAREAKGETDEQITAKEWILRRALGRRGVGGDFTHSEGTEINGSK